MNRRVVFNKFKDDQLDVKVGVALPFNGVGVFKSTSTTSEQIKYNLVNLLLTNKGEKLFDPNFGCDLRKLIFDPATSKDVVEQMIQPQIDTYLDSIEITRIDVDTSYSDYTLVLKIEYKIKHTSVTDTLDIAI